jgi:hypothetical protein
MFEIDHTSLGFVIIASCIFCGTAFGQANSQTITPEFKKSAWRAIDAIIRVDEYINDDRMGNSVSEQLRIIDAERTADEAKYEATNEFERQKAAVLVMAAAQEVKMSRLDLTDPSWKQDKAHEEQCLAEAKVQVAPEEMTVKEKDAALKQTCTINQAWEPKQ